MRDVKLTFTTNGSGAATATSDTVSGRLAFVEWVDGTLDDGVDAVFAVTSPSGVDHTFLTLTDANNDARYNVTAAAHTSAGAAVTNGHVPVYIHGKVTVTIAQGGSVKSGAAYLFLE